jgi:integrase/recombinase XerD
MASIATASIFIDTHHPNKDKECAISIRVTHNRKRKYYITKYKLTELDFERTQGKKPRDNFKNIAEDLNEQLRIANKVINSLQAFSFDLFEKKYLTNDGAKDTVNSAFLNYIKTLRKEERIGTALSYENANNSLKSFYGPKYDSLKFIDITTDFLKAYEKSMLNQGRSVSTVGIYLRSLRTMFNEAISQDVLSKEYYPFGRRKYEIPTSVNVKKALTIDDIKSIFYYPTKAGSFTEMAKDYWVFMYLCNGINVKDMCQLKWQNIEGETLQFVRAKTIRTKRKIEPIRISLHEQAKAIIEKYGTTSRKPSDYIFPTLEIGLSAEAETNKIKQLTHVINDNLARIKQELKIEKPVTTYTARHSFATILKRNGVSTAFISESLGHNNERTTQSYLDSFEDESKKEISKVLTAFV